MVAATLILPFALMTSSSTTVFFADSSTKSSSAPGGGAAPARDNPTIAAATARKPSRPIHLRMSFLFLVGLQIGRADRADPLGVESLPSLEVLRQSFPRLDLVSVQEREDHVVGNRGNAASRPANVDFDHLGPDGLPDGDQRSH